MGLRKNYPEIFFFYADRPLTLDAAVNAALLLNEKRVLHCTLAELASKERYAALSNAFDRLALWMYDSNLLDRAELNDAPVLVRTANPVLLDKPETLFDVLKSIEVRVAPNTEQAEKFRQCLAELYPLFNTTMVQ